MSRDVELVIRAKDAATSAIDSIKDALKDLTGVQEDVGQSAKKTDNLLGELGRQLSTLNKEAKNLAVLGKVSAELDKAGSAVGRLEKDVRSSATEFARLARESQAAADAASKLRGQLESEKTVVRENTAARREASKELTAANKLVREAERNQERYNKSIAKTPDVKQGSGARSAAVFIQADLSASRAAAAQLSQDISAYKANVDRSTAAVKLLEPQVAAAARQQSKLSSETEKTSAALGRSKNDLQSARTELGGMKSVADAASKSLTGLALDQEKVTAASARMAAELARTKARLDGINQASAARPTVAPSADTSGIDQQRRKLLELRREWVSSQAEVKRLAEAMRSTTAPTEAMGQALGRAQAASRAAKLEYQGQQVALRNLAGSAQSSFAAFSASATRMSSASRVLGTTVGSTASSIAATAAALRPIVPAANAAGNALGSTASGVKSAAGALGSIGGEGRNALSTLQQLRGTVVSLTSSFLGCYAAFNQIGGVLRSYQTLEAAQSRLGAVFNQDTNRVGTELAFIERQAQRLGISFGTLADEYGKFVVAADAANFSNQATRDIFLSVAEAGRVNKLSVDQMSGVFLALQQMISKGKVSSEELRQQLGERLSGAFNIFADALGLTTSQLDAMMKKGEVIADQTTLLKFADELRKRFGPQLATALTSTSAEMGRFSDNIFQAQLRVAEGGFIDAFTRGLQSLNEYFTSREGRDFFLSLGAALGKFVDGLTAVPQYFGAIQAAIATIIGLKLASFFTSVVTSIRSTQGSLTAAVASFYSWNATVKSATGVTTLFAGATTATRGPLASLVLQLRLAQLGFNLLGAKATAAQVGLTVLRGTTTALVGTFRLLYAALGGIPGIVLTGITFALGSWLTSVDNTTSALDEHKRIMGEVITAYDTVKGKTEDWGKAVKNVSLDQARTNLRQMTAEFENLRKTTTGVSFTDFGSSNGLRRRDSGQFDIAKQMSDAQVAFKSAGISAKDYLAQLDDLYAKASDPAVQQFGEALLESARSAAQAEERYGAAALTVQQLGGASEGVSRIVKETGVSMEKLADVTDDAGESSEKSAEKSKLFGDNLKEIREIVPSLKAELERLDQVAALDKLYQDAAKAARTMSELTALTKDYNTALDQINSNALDKVVAGGSTTGSVVDKIIGIESGGNANAKNPNSTATGAGQFIETTFLNLFKKYFPATADGMGDAAILELRKNAKISRELVEAYARENAAILQKAGLAVNDASIYLAHFLGPGGATKLLSASGSTPTSDILGADQINANKSILQGKTAQEVYDWAAKKVGVTKQDAEVSREVQEIETKRVEKATEYNTELENRLSLQDQENANGGKLTREAFIQKGLAEEQNRAREAGVKLGADTVAKLTEQLGLDYDLKNAKTEAKTEVQAANTALQQANALAAQRNALETQYNAAKKSGDVSLATSLQEQMVSVNEELQAAIANATAMWQAIGGDQADVALTKLDTLRIKASDSKKEINFLGLDTQKVGQLAGSFADGIVGVFGQFAESIANGENAIKSLGTAFQQFVANFLQEMAQVILRASALQAIKGFLGVVAPGVNIGTAHTGGIVGSNSIGSGNGRRNVSPALFAGAMRFHGGGIVGLKPNEVPAVLQQGEEVLTASDPRHSFNGGGAAPAASSGGAVTIVNQIDPGEVISQAMKSPTGERVILNFMTQNRARIKKALE